MEYIIGGIVVAVALAVSVFLWWLRKNDDYWEKRGVPFQPRMSLFTALRLFVSRPLHELILEQYQRYGRNHGVFELRTPALIVNEPGLLRDILVKDFHNFPNRREFKAGDPIIDKMVSLLKNEDWKRVRTIITPAFTSKRMRQMSNIINESSQTVVDTFGKYSDRGEPVDCKEVFGAFTMDVIACSAFATKIDSHNDPDNPFVRNVKNTLLSPSFLRIIFYLIIPKWFVRKFRMGGLTSLDFFKNVILDVIEKRKKLGNKFNDILQLLLDAQEEVASDKSKADAMTTEQEDETDQFGSVTSKESLTPKSKYSKLSEEELIAQCVLFFLVGYETTASTLSYLAYNLALNPQCQEKLIKEVDDAFEKHKELNYDIIRDMKYLDWIVSETLRMHPVAPRSERQAVEEYKLGDTGIVIEKGMQVGFSIIAMHYDPEFFYDPEKFDPERFKPENLSHPQYAYLPFGAGPRNCLGMRFALMEIKLCICNILRHHRLKRAPNTKIPMEYKKANTLLSPTDVFLSIERRSDVRKEQK